MRAKSTTTVGHLMIRTGKCEGVYHNQHGNLELGPLEGTLGYIDAAHGEVGLDLTHEGGGPLAELPLREIRE
jgi:hypothetical protein